MLHVLVVDDSPTVQKFVATHLQQFGFRTTSAATAEEGIRVAKDDHPDLVLMDIVFPGMSGLHATRRIVRDPDTADIPVVLMSVRGSTSDLAWGMRQGASDYLVKPFQVADLLTTVRRNLAAAD